MIEALQLQLLLATFAAWVGRQQAAVIAYLIEENRVLKEQLESGERRLRFTDDPRRRLAAKGKPLGRNALRQIATLVIPETILAWHRKLIAAKWTYARKRVGRPGVMREIRELIVRMAEENRSCNEGFLTGKRFLIIDRDGIFSPRFKAIVENVGVEIILAAYQAPNMNAYAERFVRSIKSECFGQMIFLGEASLDRAVAEYVVHDHDERSHQGIGNEIISGAKARSQGVVDVTERLGGLLKYYHRRAA
jgi:hypothetical protein